MRKAAEKLKNRRGASLMAALLLFLVCAVVGSAVLVAGTAATGRMSKIAETDRRYYSVNSAAGLFIDLLDGKTVTIKETAPAAGTRSYEVKEGDGSYTPVNPMTPPTSFPLVLACRIASDPLPAAASLSLSPTEEGSAPPLAAVLSTVMIVERISEDTLDYTISSGEYSLQLIFAADRREARSKIGTTTVTETSITWKLSDVI